MSLPKFLAQHTRKSRHDYWYKWHMNWEDVKSGKKKWWQKGDNTPFDHRLDRLRASGRLLPADNLVTDFDFYLRLRYDYPTKFSASQIGYYFLPGGDIPGMVKTMYDYYGKKNKLGTFAQYAASEDLGACFVLDDARAVIKELVLYCVASDMRARLLARWVQSNPNRPPVQV